MRLSRIKLSGFKSFVDPTQIALPGQVVGVVGPNGCGKSNVIDALRWVLGESRASALRGGSMQDVIFNGSVKRKPVSLASVELIFDNAQGKAAGQWASYSEIGIKRSLTREGKSGYYINGQQVRRKDITDIFLGTGLGARAYAIIEQGMISRIIDARPEELRVFLEEAAGVSRYRDRRRETENRMRDTRDNLQRVGDLLQELDKQVAHLSAQAEVASRYQSLTAQRDQSQQLIWLLKKQRAQADQQGCQLRITQLQTEIEQKNALLSELDHRLEQRRQQHFAWSDQVHQQQGELYSFNAEIARIEQQMRHVEETRQRIERQRQTAKEEIERQQQQLQQLQSELCQWQGRQETALMEIETQQMRVEQWGDELPESEQQLRQIKEQLFARQQQQLSLQHQIQSQRSQRQHYLRTIQQHQTKIERLQQEYNSLPAVEEEDSLSLQQEVAALQQTCASCEAELAQCQDDLAAARLEHEAHRHQWQQLQQKLTEVGARAEALQQLQSASDSDQKLQDWLTRLGLEDSRHLWQFLEVDPQWELALEAVLQKRLNARTVSQFDAVLAAESAPPAPLALVLDAPVTTAEFVDEEAEWTTLYSQLKCHLPSCDALLSVWLAGCYIMPDLQQAMSAAGNLPPRTYFVTAQGHLVDAQSVQFYAPENQLHGVLARQREIDQLMQLQQQYSDQSQQMQQTVQHGSDRQQAFHSRIDALQQSLKQASQQYQQKQLACSRLEQQLQHQRHRREKIDQDLLEYHGLIEELQQQLEETDLSSEQLQQQEENLAEQVAADQEQVETVERLYSERQQQMQQINQSLQEARFEQRNCQTHVAQCQRGIQQLHDALAQQQSQLMQLDQEVEVQSVEESRQQLQQVLSARQHAEEKLHEAERELEQVAAQLKQDDEKRLQCELGLNPLQQQLQQSVLKEQEARLTVEQWQQQLSQAEADEAVLQQQLSEENLSLSALQSRLQQLERQIKALGAVNLAALEELEAATERKQYLQRQADDLEGALQTLEEAIAAIDRESRSLLMQTFNQVNEQLAQKFPVLFGGGEARLEMTGEEILDSGVQVMAQPPGKKNRSIQLMSGGEKALTAISLVFSLFQLNPAPFCLLDEVDAPLDDTNTERLCRLIKQMSQQTQFVFISHNKITMSLAQQLIGVTMQEQGVSKVVAVDLEQARQLVD